MKLSTAIRILKSFCANARDCIEEGDDSGDPYAVVGIGQDEVDALQILTELGAITLGCPGCINCGPPILVKADEGCGSSGLRGQP